ncbi:SCO2523 family variant P-loop protein [Nocardia sp. NBC_01377]|uniref:SCO2523 family variant P-loop protein n=1 Tax=Nocardia sp. NBC_01377 TaxID=2903595 RepID=UPI0032552664
MIVFATSDKGGTGRSVTSCNIAYRLCLSGQSVVYADFDFGSPTAGALFEISSVSRGVTGETGLHSYLLGRNGTTTRLDVYASTDRAALRRQRHRSGKLMLIPGDAGGGEFLDANDPKIVERCAGLLLGLEQRYTNCIVDLSAGRSMAMDLVLRATVLPHFRATRVCWLVFHRWTRQHILAANGLVHGARGLLDNGAAYGHNPDTLLESVRFVRTAVPQVDTHTGAVGGPQAAWVQEQDAALSTLASDNLLGESKVLGSTPVEPILQWREQVILDADVTAEVANPATVTAFSGLAARLIDEATWESVETPEAS